MTKRRTQRSTTVRPAYVPADFAGRCKIFPAPRDDGREPLTTAYQADWVEDNSRLIIAEKSRQIGWSWAEALKIDLNLSLDTARLDHWVSSRDEIQARLFLDDCKGFAEILQMAAKDLGEQVIDDKGGSALVLEFANGRRVHSMSSNPDAQAGKRGGRTLDEFGLHRDPRRLYDIAYPGITWGGALSIFSTHRGTGNFFNSLVNEIKHEGNPKGFSLHTVTLQHALDDGFLYKLQKKLPKTDARQQMDEGAYFNFIKAGCTSTESFLQEYMCQPDDDAAAFITWEMITACEDKGALKGFNYLETCANPLYVGVDVGRKKDLTVIDVEEKVGDVLWERQRIELSKKTFAEQEFELYRILALPQVKRACIDGSGLGMQLAERAKERFGYKVESITFTGPVKEELAFPLRAAHEDRTLRYAPDARLRADLRGIKKETTAANNIRFVGESDDSHCDRFWAKALALHALGKNVVMGGVVCE